MSEEMKDIWREIDDALSPSNARRYDGDNNYKKCLDLKICVVGAEDGSPVFFLEATSPRSAVNDLGCSIAWSTEDRVRAAAFLRSLADKIKRPFRAEPKKGKR